jgi:DNA-binding response OmpR family regulator
VTDSGADDYLLKPFDLTLWAQRQREARTLTR